MPSTEQSSGGCFVKDGAIGPRSDRRWGARPGPFIQSRQTIFKLFSDMPPVVQPQTLDDFHRFVTATADDDDDDDEVDQADVPTDVIPPIDAPAMQAAPASTSENTAPPSDPVAVQVASTRDRYLRKDVVALMKQHRSELAHVVSKMFPVAPANPLLNLVSNTKGWFEASRQDTESGLWRHIAEKDPATGSWVRPGTLATFVKIHEVSGCENSLQRTGASLTRSLHRRCFLPVRCSTARSLGSRVFRRFAITRRAREAS